MSHVSKQIYRKIHTLFPDLEKMKPFSASDFKLKGANMNMVVLDSSPEEINVVLNRYGKGELAANLSVEVCVHPKDKIAYVKTYKDNDYFHSAISKPTENSEMSLSKADYFLYDWLKNLKYWDRNKSTSNTVPQFSR